MEPRIFIIILNWNGREETAACLKSICTLDYQNYRVVLVDNASTDGSPERIAQRFPEVLLILNKTNLGFDGGNNIGIQKALAEGAEAVLLLNNDTIVDSHMLSALARAASSLPRAGILGPKIYYLDEPQKIWCAGMERGYSPTGWLLSYVSRGNGEVDKGQHDKLRKVDAVTGCAIFVKREVFADIGLFDERFFAYHEEIDLCYRALKAGWECYIVPEAKVWHKVSRTLRERDSPTFYRLWARNWLLVSRKQTAASLWPLLYWAYVRETYWVYRRLRAEGKLASAEGVLAGIWEALMNRFGPPSMLKAPRWLNRLAEWDYGRRSARI